MTDVFLTVSNDYSLGGESRGATYRVWVDGVPTFPPYLNVPVRRYTRPPKLKQPDLNRRVKRPMTKRPRITKMWKPKVVVPVTQRPEIVTRKPNPPRIVKPINNNNYRIRYQKRKPNYRYKYDGSDYKKSSNPRMSIGSGGGKIFYMQSSFPSLIATITHPLHITSIIFTSIILFTIYSPSPSSSTFHLLHS